MIQIKKNSNFKIKQFSISVSTFILLAVFFSTLSSKSPASEAIIETSSDRIKNEKSTLARPFENETIRTEIEYNISDQIKAFRNQDFQRAYKYASPSIKFFFPSAESFCKMIKESYPMIWDPEKYEFLEIQNRLGIIFQRVMFTDQNGKNFVFDYQMRKVKANWNINGVFIVKVLK